MPLDYNYFTVAEIHLKSFSIQLSRLSPLTCSESENLKLESFYEYSLLQIKTIKIMLDLKIGT